jgi:hypothetical protein
MTILVKLKKIEINPPVEIKETYLQIQKFLEE